MAQFQANYRLNNKSESHPYEQLVIKTNRVTRVVKGGRRMRLRALVVLGDKKGFIGVGCAKGADNAIAISKACDVAQKNMKRVVIEDAGTIPHEVYSKVAGAKIFLKPAKEGTGLIAGGTVRQILELAGYHNVYSKSLGNNNNPINVAYAVIDALEQLVAKSDWHLNKIKDKKDHGKV